MRVVVEAQRLAERAHQQRLGDARHTLQQDVTAREQRDHEAGDGAVLSDDGFADLGAHPGEGVAQVVGPGGGSAGGFRPGEVGSGREVGHCSILPVDRGLSGEAAAAVACSSSARRSERSMS